MVHPLLTIAIPTFNRCSYLQQNLLQLRSEIGTVEPGLVEVLVSDNCSPDDTPAVVQRAKDAGLAISYVRNPSNLGWGANFAQCYNLARGTYVLLLGDDDLLVDGALSLLLRRLSERRHGVVCLRSYGFDHDFRREFPGRFGKETTYEDPGEFLLGVGALVTLLSSCVINKTWLPSVQVSDFARADLAALRLVLHAAVAAGSNLYVGKYLVAGKRNNSSNYSFSDVFVVEMWQTLDDFVGRGLTRTAVRRLEDKLLFSYYPFYLFSMRLDRAGDRRLLAEHFAHRFRGRWQYDYWLRPVIAWPRPLALLWGAAVTFVGRAADGDLRRGASFAWSRVLRAIGTRIP